MSAERCFDDVLRENKLCRADAEAGVAYLWGRWQRVIADRLAGKTYAEIKAKRNGYFWNTDEVERTALHIIKNTRFENGHPVIPKPIKDAIVRVRKRENHRNTEWMRALCYHCEVTE